jgi:hypothetical protein
LGLYVSIFDSGIYAIDPNYDCGLDVLGSSSTVFYLNDTLGVCTALSDSSYYSLDTYLNTVNFMCYDADCSTCDFVSEDLKLNECYQVQNQSYSIFKCINI